MLDLLHKFCAASVEILQLGAVEVEWVIAGLSQPSQALVERVQLFGFQPHKFSIAFAEYESQRAGQLPKLVKKHAIIGTL